MSNTKLSPRAVSKISAAASTLTTSSTQKSSILKSAFSPSPLQLSLFASVIQGFDSQHLRIHDTASGRLRCEHAAGLGTKISSLDWGYYGTSYRQHLHAQNKKKRKRRSNKDDYGVVAYGTIDSEICMFAPAEAKVVGKLRGPHERGVKDFRFAGEDCLAGWSIGGEGKLVLWDLSTDSAIRSISLPDPNISALTPSHQFPTTQTLCASSTPYSITCPSDTEHSIDTFDSFKGLIHSIITSSAINADPPDLFLAADHDRYINIFNLKERRLVRSLIASSGVDRVSLSALDTSREGEKPDLLAVTNQNGVVELFVRPFSPPAKPTINGSIKSKRKDLTRRSDASIKVIRADASRNPLTLFDASVQGPDVIVAWASGGIEVGFQKIRWQDEGTGELLFDGLKEIVSAKNSSSLGAATMNGVKHVGRVHVDESRTVLADNTTSAVQPDAIEISSDEEADDEEDVLGSEVDDAVDTADANEEPTGEESVDGTTDEEEEEEDGDAEMADADDENPGDANLEGSAKAPETPEPSFGELLAAQNPEVIPVASVLVPADSSTLVEAEPQKSVAIPSGISLSTVLTQSLRTNDQSLLESCFHTTDLATIRLTIQRLDSSLAGILLQKLAERLSSRPGRVGPLLNWVQWTCIIHGGAIAGRPDVSTKIKTLYKVLAQRSRSLDDLLLLKGKLDMLDAQLNLRKQLQAERRPPRDPADDVDVIYIEGQDEESSGEEDEAAPPQIEDAPPRQTLHDRNDIEPESEDDEDMPMTNGAVHAEDDVSNEETDEEVAEEEDPGVVDDEAIESDGPESDGGADLRASDQDDESEEDEEEDGDEDGDEEDSEMADFIDDGPLSEPESRSEISIDDTPEKPPAKKSRHA